MINRDDESLKGKAEIIVAKQRNGPTRDVLLTFLHEYTSFAEAADVQPGETAADIDDYPNF